VREFASQKCHVILALPSLILLLSLRQTACQTQIHSLTFCHLILFLFRHLMQIIIIIIVPMSSLFRPGLLSLFEVEFALAGLVREVLQQQRLIGILQNSSSSFSSSYLADIAPPSCTSKAVCPVIAFRRPAALRARGHGSGWGM